MVPIAQTKLRHKDGHHISVSDGHKLFVYAHEPEVTPATTIFMISGITGINHQSESDVTMQLSDGKHRVVIIHPRGTGYSEGRRGGLSDFSRFIEDFIEIIKSYQYSDTSNEHSILLYGHSMSCAIVLEVAKRLSDVGGILLVNPAYLLKKAKGMSPRFRDYVKYAWYSLFARHRPVVNMAGSPANIENREDRLEAEARREDPLLVKYFSLYMMMESKKLMNRMLDSAKKTNIPLLLLYGAEDSIVDQSGCDVLYSVWKHEDKQYYIVEEGAHGRSTVIKAKEVIRNWIDSHIKPELCD